MSNNDFWSKIIIFNVINVNLVLLGPGPEILSEGEEVVGGVDVNPGNGGETMEETLGVVAFSVIMATIEALAKLVVEGKCGACEGCVVVVGEGGRRGEAMDFGKEVFEDGGEIKGGTA